MIHDRANHVCMSVILDTKILKILIDLIGIITDTKYTFSALDRIMKTSLYQIVFRGQKNRGTCCIHSRY
jgi:hypothetical protein